MTAQRLILLCLPGDGIGPEITAATREVVTIAAGTHRLSVEFEQIEIGLIALKEQGTTLPQAAIDAAKAADGVILGPAGSQWCTRPM